jgi:hypothetical protein
MGQKWPQYKGLEIKNPPISAEVRKTWIYTSTTPYVFMK